MSLNFKAKQKLFKEKSESGFEEIQLFSSEEIHLFAIKEILKIRRSHSLFGKQERRTMPKAKTPKMVKVSKRYQIFPKLKSAVVVAKSRGEEDPVSVATLSTR